MMRDHRRDFTFMSLMVILFITKTVPQRATRIRPIYYSLPAPPVLNGPTATNYVLTNAEKVHQRQIRGPTSFVNHDGHLYTITRDSMIYDLASCPPRLVANLAAPGCRGAAGCEHLVSLRRDPDTGYLLVLDTFRGLFAVNPKTGQQQLIFSASTSVNGRPSVHLNDMVVSPDGVIIMSDSSDVYNIDNDVYVCMDGRPTSRLVALHPKTGLVNELLAGYFNFANGLELTPDGDLLVGETCRATIHRVSLKRTSWLRTYTFSVNLPGLPDNIRSSGRGTYWVAMTYPRHSGISNPVDENSRNPNYRGMGFRRMSLSGIRNMFVKWGTIVELDATGNIIRALHDPTGATLTMVTEVNEFGGVLNIASHLVDYMVRVLLPPETGVKISVESFIQVKRSRCQLPDSQVEALRRQLMPEVTTQTPTTSTVKTSTAMNSTISQ